MSDRSKLHALKKAAEAHEHDVAKEVAALRDVLGRRKERLDLASVEIDSLKGKLKWTRGDAVEPALSAGDAESVKQRGLSANRLTALIAEKENALESIREEYNKARERCELGEQELLDARVERKRVEHLMEQKDLRKRREKSARDEAEADELAIRSKRK